jgi:hypothetical protein
MARRASSIPSPGLLPRPSPRSAIIPLGRVRDPERLAGWPGCYRLALGLGPGDHRHHHDQRLPADAIKFVAWSNTIS